MWLLEYYVDKGKLATRWVNDFEKKKIIIKVNSIGEKLSSGKKIRSGYIYESVNAEIFKKWVPDIDAHRKEQKQKNSMRKMTEWYVEGGVAKQKIIEVTHEEYERLTNNKGMTKTPEAETAIQETYKTPESIYNGPYNKTALFLLPMIDLTLRNSAIKKYLKNAYLDDAEYDHDYTRPIFILLKTATFEEQGFKDINTCLRAMKTYKVDYDLGKQDGMNLVMYVFETPEKWKADYYHFKAGRYSKFTSEYKLKFPKEIIDNNKKVESLVYGVIHKTDYRKDQVAAHFCVKDADGKIKDQKEYEEMRRNLNFNAEIWEQSLKKHEVYRFKE